MPTVSIRPRRLLELGVEASSGRYLSPPPRHEALVTDLLAVDHLAATVHHAPSRCRGWTDANPRLVKAGAGFLCDVVFYGQEVWSFRRFDEPPLDMFSDVAPEDIGTDELSSSSDPADQTLLRWLMGATLGLSTCDRGQWQLDIGSVGVGALGIAAYAF